MMPGDTTTWFMGKCWVCGVDIPFATRDSRDQWVAIHGATPHVRALAPHGEHINDDETPLMSTREVTK